MKRDRPPGVLRRDRPGMAEKGSVLMIGLIMLVLLTILTLTSFRVGKGNLQVVANSQQKLQALAAAQGAIEKTISTAQFSATPNNALPTPCNGVANTDCVDVDGDGTTDINVTVVPKCVSNQIIANASLNLAKAEDKGCTLGNSQDFGTEGASTSNSLCTNILWDVAATASDATTGARLTANQGVALRVSSSQTCP